MIDRRDYTRCTVMEQWLGGLAGDATKTLAERGLSYEDRVFHSNLLTIHDGGM